MKNKKQPRTAFVLEGGAMRGLYSAGVLDVFMKNDILADAIYGVSAGALFGINFKSGQIGRAIRYNLKYAHEKNYMGLYSLITTGNIMNKDFCFNKLVYELDKFDFETFASSPIDFYAVVTNIETGKAEYIKIADAKEGLEALRASGSMPFVSKCVEFKGMKYLDGAMSDPIPIRRALNDGYEKIIVVLTRPENYKKHKKYMPYDLFYKKYPNFVKTASKQFENYNKTLDLIKELENKGKVFVFRPSLDLKIARVEKNIEKLKAIYDLGVEDCIFKLDQIKEYLI